MPDTMLNKINSTSAMSLSVIWRIRKSKRRLRAAKVKKTG